MFYTKFSSKMTLNPYLHERVSEHRDQKYFGEVSFWPAEFRKGPPIVPLIFNFKNFGEFQKFLIRPEMHYLNAIFCLMQLNQYWNKIMIYKVANFIVTTALILKNQVNRVLYAAYSMLKIKVSALNGRFKKSVSDH
jgi:hypothetical protein